MDLQNIHTSQRHFKLNIVILIFINIRSTFSNKWVLFCDNYIPSASHMHMGIYITYESIWAIYPTALKDLGVLTLIQHCFRCSNYLH